MTAPQLATKDLRRVVIAAAVGNVIEWYDFYIFCSLAALLPYTRNVPGQGCVEPSSENGAPYKLRVRLHKSQFDRRPSGDPFAHRCIFFPGFATDLRNSGCN